MANKIVVVDRPALDSVRLLFLADLDPMIMINGSPFAPTPAENLPEVVTAFGMLDPGDIAVLDAGTGVFMMTSIPVKKGETNQQSVAKARAVYAAEVPRFIAELRNRHQFSGVTFSP